VSEVVDELLGLEMAMVEPVLDLLEIEEEVVRADAMGPQETLFRIGPEPLDAVDGSRTPNVLPFAVSERLMIGVPTSEAMVTHQGVGVHRGLDADLLVDDGLEDLARDVRYRLGVDDPVGAFVDPEHDGLQALGSPPSLDHPGFLQTLSGSMSPISEPGAEVGLVDFDLSVEQGDRAFFVGCDRLADVEEEPMHLVVGQTHPPSDRVVGQFEFEPREQLVDFHQAEPRSGQRGGGKKTELLPASFALPSAVGKPPELPRVATVDTLCPCTESDSTEDPLCSRVAQVTRKDPFHQALTLNLNLTKCQMPNVIRHRQGMSDR
jgi:hypothetical protein